MLNQQRVHFVRGDFSEALEERLRMSYPALKVLQSSATELQYDDAALSTAERLNVRDDLQFFNSTPHIAVENLCSRMSNYQPLNESQAELMRHAQRLLEIEQKSAAGLYMYGDAGIGKTHMAVAIAKECMRRGFQPNFQSAERFTFSTNLQLGDEQVWIIDDLNSGYGVASRLFRAVVLHVHERGGRLFITSNKSYDQLIKELFVGDDPANRLRYDDRSKSMMKVLHVIGESQRQSSAWYH